jgi:hypothetical protein
MTYAEGRDFYNNATRLSADEFNRLTPVMKRQVAQFSQALNKAIQSAADSVGQGETYSSAMSEYANASNLARAGKTLWDFTVKRALPAGGIGAAGALGWDLFRNR